MFVQSASYFLVIVDYSTIFMENDSVYRFAFFGTEKG